MNKLVSIKEAVSLIQDGEALGVGGNVLHRSPMALIREIIRQNKKDLKVIKTAGAMDVDMLCYGQCVHSVDAGFISYESEYSLANHYRKAVQEGRVRGNEHACYTVISALRAGSYGIGFMPVKGLIISDLIQVNDYFKKIKDPFSGEEVTVVRALRPDTVIIHVHEADERGNARIYGPKFDDVLLAKAAKKVIISAEKLVTSQHFIETQQKVDIPEILVTAVVHAKEGARPCSCLPYYDIAREDLKYFKTLKNQTELEDYLRGYEIKDYK